MHEYGLDISGNNTSSTWSIFNAGGTVDSGTTGPISLDPVTNEIIFKLFDSLYYDDLVFKGYRSGNGNPCDIVNAGLEGDHIIPTPFAIGQPDFGPEELVQAGGSDLTVSGYSVPSYWDWDNDGLPDLIVGEGSGSYTAKVRVYLNTGSVSSPSFSTYFYAQSGGSDLTVPGGG